MLQKHTVEDSTFELLKQLQNEPLLQSTRLVGGTALSLQLGHRISEDLDLFTTERFDTDIMLQVLSEKYDFTPRNIGPYTLIGEINGVKIDVIYHPFKWLSDEIKEESTRIASKNDIAAMKLHAIINSGKRPKDFVDVAFLSQFFSYDTMKQLLLEKYPKYDPIMADRAITFFGDIEPSLIPSIKLVSGKLDFERVKMRLYQMTDYPYKIFDNPPIHLPQKHRQKPDPKFKL